MCCGLRSCFSVKVQFESQARILYKPANQKAEKGLQCRIYQEKITKLNMTALISLASIVRSRGGGGGT